VQLFSVALFASVYALASVMLERLISIN